MSPLRTESPSLANERARRRESFLHGYLPPRDPVVDPSVVFHRESDPVDAVSYEVIRSKLWNLNVDHGDTIRRISGSHIVVEGYDFNCAITNETGDAVTLCPYSMFFAGFADEVVKWTLEHRSMNVGIRDGDVFLQDDPWIGSNHAMDTAVFGPVFVDGKLFAWLFNCVHQRELGGTRPGGFIQEARDCHSEPTFMPPIKLVENDVIREDVADAWTRRSRLPELMALELKSQVAGFRTARDRLQALVARYGARAIKGTMNKMVDDTARIVGARLASLPDAVWRDERYIAGANPGDPRLFKLSLVFEKKGDRLRVSNEGTDPATGSFNVTPGVFRAAVLNGLLPVLAFDQVLCAAGVLRQLDFDFVRGAITSASHPSAVGTSMSSVATVGHAHGLASKMVSGHDELARHAFAASAMHTMSTTAPSWRDARGNLVGDAILDMLAGSIGAFAHRDGIDFGGCTFAVANRMSDVEKAEQHIPMLYLFRRELAASGGHGRFRGGPTYSCAWVGHGQGSESAAMHATGYAKSVTMGLGIAGGFPGTGGYHWHAKQTDIQRELAAGRIPGSPEALRALAPHGEYLGLRQDNRLTQDDLFELLPNPGAGWGDTLDREPALVAADVARQRLSPELAASLYGVVLATRRGAAGNEGAEGTHDAEIVADVEATAARRAQLRRERLAQARAPRSPRAGAPFSGPPTAHAFEGVAIHGGPGARELACARCGHRLGAGSEGYRRGCGELDLPLEAIGREFLPPTVEVGEPLVLRRYLCPGCGVVLDAEIARPQDEPSADLRLLD